MDSKTTIPSFTVSLRGYDRVEVDEYLDSLADALSQVEEGQEQNRRLQAHVGRLNGRIKDLEDRINADTPKTGAIIGERIGIMLRTAEETAADTVQRAEARAAELITQAEQRVAESEDNARMTVAGGQEQARRIEASARAEAAEIISEAETRASARTRQIEQWAEQVVSHTRAEEARMLREQQEKRNAALAELAGLREQRDAVAATLADLRETLGQALGLVVPPVAPNPPAGITVSAGPDAAVGNQLVADTDTDGAQPYAGEPSDLAVAAPAETVEAAPPVEADTTDDADTAPEAGDGATVVEGPQADEPAADTVAETSARPPFDGEATEVAPQAPEVDQQDPVTSEIEIISAAEAAGVNPEDDEFEAKLEAWVSEGAKHFRRM